MSDFFDAFAEGPSRKISADDFQREWGESYQAATGFKSQAFLLLSAGRLFLRKGDLPHLFSSAKDLFDAKLYLLSQIRLFEESLLKKMQNDSPSIDHVILLIKAYHITNVQPSAAIQEKLFANNLYTALPTPSFKDFRYMLHNIAGLNVYPGDEWIKAWKESLLQRLEDGLEIRDVELFDILYSLTILDFIRGKREASSQAEESPCADMARGILAVLKDRTSENFALHAARLYYNDYGECDERLGQIEQGNRPGKKRALIWDKLERMGYKRFDRNMVMFPGTVRDAFKRAFDDVLVICEPYGIGDFLFSAGGVRDSCQEPPAFHFKPQVEFKVQLWFQFNRSAVLGLIPQTILDRFKGMSLDKIAEAFLRQITEVNPGCYVLHAGGLKSGQDEGAWKLEIPDENGHKNGPAFPNFNLAL
ncbi:MAG: hypothetical protein JNL76_09025 [Alphaproteobacteria bacterium]|nr:hypothetical protein [Alphaproteobacteria bacterium]